jgi:hypothetical protein
MQFLERALRSLHGFTCCTDCKNRNEVVFIEFSAACDEWKALMENQNKV